MCSLKVDVSLELSLHSTTILCILDLITRAGLGLDQGTLSMLYCFDLVMEKCDGSTKYLECRIYKISDWIWGMELEENGIRFLAC